MYEKPQLYVMAADEDTLLAVIRIQCAVRGKFARKRAQAQVLLLESRAHDFEDDHPPNQAQQPPFLFERQVGQLFCGNN